MMSSSQNNANKIYFINPQKITLNPTKPPINKEVTNKSTETEKNKDLTSEDYEKLAKILQV